MSVSGMAVQSLLLSRAMFTRRQAASWAHHHGYRSQVESGRSYWRLRQTRPTGRVIRTIEFVPGIKAVVQRNPGLAGALWRGAKAGYHLHRAKMYEAKAARHRKSARLNPAARNPSAGRIPGRALEIRYLRRGANPGHYKHPFEHPVRMEANKDGSVTLRGRKRLHADDREKNFSQFVHAAHGRRNPMARRRGGIGWGTWLLVGLGALLLFKPGLLGAGTPSGYAVGTVWLDTTDGTMVVGPSQPGPNWRLATQAEIQAAVIPV